MTASNSGGGAISEKALAESTQVVDPGRLAPARTTSTISTKGVDVTPARAAWMFAGSRR
jgi:hypothetical protein